MRVRGHILNTNVQYFLEKIVKNKIITLVLESLKTTEKEREKEIYENMCKIHHSNCVFPVYFQIHIKCLVQRAVD